MSHDSGDVMWWVAPWRECDGWQQQTMASYFKWTFTLWSQFGFCAVNWNLCSQIKTSKIIKYCFFHFWKDFSFLSEHDYRPQFDAFNALQGHILFAIYKLMCSMWLGAQLPHLTKLQPSTLSAGMPHIARKSFLTSYQILWCSLGSYAGCGSAILFTDFNTGELVKCQYTASLMYNGSVVEALIETRSEF